MNNAKLALFVVALVGPALVAAQENKNTTTTHTHTKNQTTTPTAPSQHNTTRQWATVQHPNSSAASKPASNQSQHQDYAERQGRHLERAGIREDVRGIHDIHRGEALIREGHKIGGKEGEVLEREGAAMERQGDRDIRQGDAMIRHGFMETTPIPQRTSPPQPQPITRRSDFIWDHRQAPSPVIDDRGIHIDAKPVTQAPDAQNILESPKWSETVSRLEKEELTKNNHNWHYDGGTQYSHYMDQWGDHWYGIYGRDSYYWIRHHAGRYWWRDEDKKESYYWHDGGWWKQDPDSSKATPVNSSGSQTSQPNPSFTTMASPGSNSQPNPSPSNGNPNYSQSASGDPNTSNTSDSSGGGQGQSDAPNQSN